MSSREEHFSKGTELVIKSLMWQMLPKSTGQEAARGKLDR